MAADATTTLRLFPALYKAKRYEGRAIAKIASDNAMGKADAFGAPCERHRKKGAADQVAQPVEQGRRHSSRLEYDPTTAHRFRQLVGDRCALSFAIENARC
jgi:hypothetical protein